MKLVDANVLLYAVDEDSEHHLASKAWLDGALNGSESILMPWMCLRAFARVVTHPSVYPNPLEIDVALEIVERWLARPTVVTGDPDPQHVGRLRELSGSIGIGGNVVTDAHLAALALQYEATVVTFDNDFGRFPGVSWQTPGR